MAIDQFLQSLHSLGRHRNDVDVDRFDRCDSETSFRLIKQSEFHLNGRKLLNLVKNGYL